MLTSETIKSIIANGEGINEVKTKTEPAIIPDAYEFTIGGKTIVAMSIQEFLVKPVAVKGGQIDNDISESQKQVLNLIVNNPSISRGEISHLLGTNESTVSKHIAKLKQIEILERIGGNRGYWTIKNR
jgi:predicted HTH transcriptional regulator